MPRIKVAPSAQAAVWTAVKAMQTARAAQQYDRFTPYIADPVGFVTNVLHEHAWSKQCEVLESVRDNRHTAVHSCHGVGKSFIAARTAAWWLSVHPPEEAFVVTSAPSFSQVRAILWREIGRAHRKGKLPGRVNQTEWWMGRGAEHYGTPMAGEEMVAFGRKPADTDPTAFQGIHALHVLVILDEACGIPKELWDAVETLVTNDNCRVLAIGNPDDAGSEFAKKCAPGSSWNVVHISAFDSPNFTGEPIPAYLPNLLVTPGWVQERKDEWGEDSPLYMSKVSGQFPEDATDGVVPWSFVTRCRADGQEWSPDQLLPVELGLDVGGGGDWTVIRERRGVIAGRTYRALTKESTDAVGLAMRAIAETGATKIKVDVIGIGWGVAGSLKELGRSGRHRATVVDVNVSQESSDKNLYPKLRDEIWWAARMRSEAGLWDLSAVDDATISQLIEPTYKLDSLGRIKIEPKDETIKRLGHSPDDADALNLAFWNAPVAASKKVMTW